MGYSNLDFSDYDAASNSILFLKHGLSMVLISVGATDFSSNDSRV